MNTPQAPPCPSPVPSAADRRHISAFIIGIVVVVAAYSPMLWLLACHVFNTDLQQHIALVPFIAVYLVWRGHRERRVHCLIQSSKLAAALTVLVAMSVAATGWQLRSKGIISHNDSLGFGMFSFLAFLFATALLTLGWTLIRAHLFAVCFLLFTIPLPDSAVHDASVFLQHTSADAAQVMLELARTPIVREGLLFHVQGLDFAVAEQCSGIRATFILFVASLVAGQLLLRSRVHKLLLVIAVLPIAILRNGFRIASLIWLTIHVNPHVIDSPLHHRGGPLFFLLGLIPFLGCLWWLCRRETLLKPTPSAINELPYQ